MPKPQQTQDAPPPTNRTFRGWKALDLSNSRLSVADDELHARQNMMPVGIGQQSVPLYAGDPGSVLHAGTVRETFGIEMTFPGDTAPRDVFAAWFTDGEAYQRDYSTDPPTDSQISTGFATTGFTGITIWQDSPILILDPVKGYGKWDGVTFTVIDATKKGSSLAVFESRAWLVTGPRVIEYTAPDTYDDFNPANGAGAFRITDEAFEGAIFQIFSTVEQLWVIGDSAIEAIGNVQTNGGITTFSVTNAVRTLGSVFPNSVFAYYRLLAMATGYSFHALLGVTPQKLSGKIDRLFSRLTPVISTGPRAGVVTLNGQTILCFLYHYDDPVFAVVRPILVGFSEGQILIFATPSFDNQQVLDMATLKPQGIFELYGIDEAGKVFRLFARPTDDMQGDGVLQTGYYALGEPTDSLEMVRVGVDLSGPLDVDDEVSVDITVSALGRTKTQTKTVRMLPETDSPLGLRYGLLRANAPMAGYRCGVSLRVDCADRLCVEAIHIAADRQGEWDVKNP